jgi:hypothetical protein
MASQSGSFKVPLLSVIFFLPRTYDAQNNQLLNTRLRRLAEKGATEPFEVRADQKPFYCIVPSERNSWDTNLDS